LYKAVSSLWANELDMQTLVCVEAKLTAPSTSL
jgi:hypothetical protein